MLTNLPIEKKIEFRINELKKYNGRVKLNN